MDEQHIFASGENGTFVKSTDGGDSWTSSIIAPGSTILSALDFVSPEVGFTNNAGIIHKTYDGGDTWIPQSTNPLSFVDDISMLNENIGFFVGGAQFSRYLQKTTNSGGALSIDEISKGSLQVYPNPTIDGFTIEKTDQKEFNKIELFDLSGRLVKAFPINQNYYSVAQISSGQYILVIQDNYSSYSTPLIIE